MKELSLVIWKYPIIFFFSLNLSPDLILLRAWLSALLLFLWKYWREEGKTFMIIYMWTFMLVHWRCHGRICMHAYVFMHASACILIMWMHTWETKRLKVNAYMHTSVDSLDPCEDVITLWTITYCRETDRRTSQVFYKPRKPKRYGMAWIVMLCSCMQRHTFAKRWRPCSIRIEIRIRMKQTVATAHVGVVSRLASPAVVASSSAILSLPLPCVHSELYKDFTSVYSVAKAYLSQKVQTSSVNYAVSDSPSICTEIKLSYDVWE